MNEICVSYAVSEFAVRMLYKKKGKAEKSTPPLSHTHIDPARCNVSWCYESREGGKEGREGGGGGELALGKHKKTARGGGGGRGGLVCDPSGWIHAAARRPRHSVETF